MSPATAPSGQLAMHTLLPARSGEDPGCRAPPTRSTIAAAGPERRGQPRLRLPARATDTSTCIACRSALASGSRPCIRATVGSRGRAGRRRCPRAIGVVAQDRPPERRGRSRPAWPRSPPAPPGPRGRSAVAPRSRATVEIARATSMCRASSAPQLPRQPHAEAVGSVTVSTAQLARRPGTAATASAQPRRLHAAIRHPEDRRWTAVQHHPILDSLGAKEVPPTLLAHARRRSVRPSLPQRPAPFDINALRPAAEAQHKSVEVDIGADRFAVDRLARNVEEVARAGHGTPSAARPRIRASPTHG